MVGGVGAATAGASLGVTVAAGAAAGAAGNTANQLISTGKVNKKQVAVSAIGGAAGSAGAKLAGAAVNAGSKAASQAISKAAGNAGKQAAAKAGSSILGKTIAASAKGGIVGASAGASADLAMQVAKDKKHDIRNVNWKEVGGSALLGGGLGAGMGAASQTKLGQKVSASQVEWDKKVNAGIDKLKSGFKACMADDRGSVSLEFMYGKKLAAKLSGKADVDTGVGYDAGDDPVRIEGDWSINDMKQALLGHPPKGLGSPDIHHGGQMPGAAKHEVIPSRHRTNQALHQNKYNQGVTDEMRTSDKELHWWYRAREQGADDVLPDWIYDD